MQTEATINRSDEAANLIFRLGLRPAVLPDDAALLSKIYCSTREDLDLLPLAVEQKNALLRMQFEAQTDQYRECFPQAAHDIVLFDEKPAGRLIVERRATEIFGVDLALLPEFRNQGIGTALIQNLLREAAETNRVFRLSVVKTNRAARLYARLGIAFVEDTGTHFRMER